MKLKKNQKILNHTEKHKQNLISIKSEIENI